MKLDYSLTYSISKTWEIALPVIIAFIKMSEYVRALYKMGIHIMR